MKIQASFVQETCLKQSVITFEAGVSLIFRNKALDDSVSLFVLSQNCLRQRTLSFIMKFILMF
jgi:hypothetical protein